MRYLCVHCDHRFEHEGEGKPRCPKCMRRHGLEKLEEGGGGRRIPRWAIVGGVVGLVALVGAGYAWWSYATPGTVSGEVPFEPLDRGDLRDWLAHENAEAGELAGLLLPSDAVEDFAEEAAGDAEGPVAKAKALVDAVAARAEKDAFVPWSTSHPREGGDLRVPAETVKALSEDGARHHLYPLEVAALVTSALRAEDVPAMLVEAWSYPDGRSPPDPSGNFGYYLVGVWSGGEPSRDKEPKLFDPYGVRGNEPEKDGWRVLDDLDALAAALTHQAAHALMLRGDTKEALDLIESAVALDPRSPAARTVRGAVLLQTGGPQEGARELEAAAELRQDAPRRKNLAALLMAQQERDRAAQQITAALQEHPDYADAHAMLAAIHLAAGDAERARTELQTAERLDPHLPSLPQTWAQLYLAQGEPERAIEKAEEAVERRPHDWQTRLHAGQVYRAAGKYDAMRRQARAVMEMTPPERQAAMRRMVEQVLGPTALEEPLDDDLLAADDGGGLPDPDDLDLGEGSTLLGGGGSGGPSLGGGGGDRGLDLGDEGSGPLLLGSDPSKLKLREPNQQLRLDLDE